MKYHGEQKNHIYNFILVHMQKVETLVGANKYANTTNSYLFYGEVCTFLRNS